MEDDFSIFHSGNFLPFHIPFQTKIFFHIPFHTKREFKREEKCNLCSTLAALSVTLQVVALEGKQLLVKMG